MLYPGLLHPEPLLLRQATVDPYFCRRHSNTDLVQSLWLLWFLVHTRIVCAICVSQPGWGLILNMISPPYCLAGLLLCLWMWGLFFGGIQHSPVDCCSAASCNFGVLAGEDECTSVSSTIFLCHQTPLSIGILQARLELVAMPSSQGMFPNQGLNLGVLRCRRILDCLSRQLTLWPLSSLEFSPLF